MTRKNENWLAWALATIGIVGAGFAAGMHRLVWALFWVIAAIWILLCWWYGSKSRGDELFMWWLLAIGATLVIGIVLRIVEGTVLVLFGGLQSLADSSTPTSPQDEPRQK